MYARTVRALQDDFGNKNESDQCPALPWFVETFGPELMVGFNRNTHGKLESHDTNGLLRPFQYIGVYFAANWAPDYCNFTPELLRFYESVQNWKPQLMEIVYVSADCSLDKYEELMCTKYSFPAVPFEDTGRKEALRKRFDCRVICSLVVLDHAGTVISKSARLDIENAKHDFSLALAAWNASASSGFTPPGGCMVQGVYTLYGERDLEVILMLKDNGQFFHSVKLLGDEPDAEGNFVGYDADRAGMYRVVKNLVYLTYTQDHYSVVKRKTLINNEWVTVRKIEAQVPTTNNEYAAQFSCVHVDALSKGAHRVSSHPFQGSKPVVVLKDVPGILGTGSPAPSHTLHANWTRLDWGNTFMSGEADEKRHFAFSKLHAVHALTESTQHSSLDILQHWKSKSSKAVAVKSPPRDVSK